jgi:plastocyanin
MNGKNQLVAQWNADNRMRRAAARLSLLLALLITVTACGQMPGEVQETASPAPLYDGASPSPGAEETTPSPGAEEATPSPEAAGDVETVEVGLTEFEINMPSSLPAGPTTFNVTNNGTVEHNFEVEGQGIEKVFDQNLQSGETKTMQVDLQPGTYQVYCPVANHEELGMTMELTVTE